MTTSIKYSPPGTEFADHGESLHRPVRSGRSPAKPVLLFAGLALAASLLASAPSIAATLTVDLTGMPRSTPAVTMGALAASDQLALPVAPTGLSLQISE